MDCPAESLIFKKTAPRANDNGGRLRQLRKNGWQQANVKVANFMPGVH
jgi:hypothetical protein